MVILMDKNEILIYAFFKHIAIANIIAIEFCFLEFEEINKFDCLPFGCIM